ncbi:MAG: hypothetical protein M1827_001971 [Pycnora praestabilis]|nr:MAG: hypothetical protein M1827_001971 [Pycnora praestabilis]
MVYCGPPSRGCYACRERKIRCDQRREGCANCLKAHRECPGYRDQLSLLFRNETKAVTKKSEAKAITRNEVASSSSPKSNATAVEGNPETSFEVLRRLCVHSSTSLTYSHTLLPTWDERGTGFFFANYVVGINSPSKGQWSDVPAHSNTGSEQALLSSMKAVGLAGFASSQHAPGVMREAQKRYLAAIQFTNSALRSPVDVKKDSTLLAVMILGIFETISGGNQQSLNAWQNHLNGAAALLKLRGREQLSTSGGRRMVLQVVSSLVVSCLQHGVAIPTQIMDLRAEAASYLASSGLIWRFQDTMVLFTNFRAYVRQEVITDPEVILAEALELDKSFISIFSDLTPQWQYQTVYTDADPKIVFSGCYHVYHDYLVAQIWNAMRCFRILLNEEIRGVLLTGFSSIPPRFSGTEFLAQFQKSTDALYQLQSDILSSVPQHLGYTSKRHAQSSTACSHVPAEYDSSGQQLWSGFKSYDHLKTHPSESMSSDLPMIRLSGGYLLPWPLYLAGVTDVATNSTMRWVTECLRSLGRSRGIQQAMVLAQMVETKMNIRFPHPQ